MISREYSHEQDADVVVARADGLLQVMALVPVNAPLLHDELKTVDRDGTVWEVLQIVDDAGTIYAVSTRPERGDAA